MRASAQQRKPPSINNTKETTKTARNKKKRRKKKNKGKKLKVDRVGPSPNTLMRPAIKDDCTLWQCEIF
jgi:hypothetical protein